MLRFSLLVPLAVIVACHDDRPHTFQTPPPAAPKVVPPVQAQVTEAPIGTEGPGAYITAVNDENGGPAELSNVQGPLRVTTLVARGPGGWYPDASARIELRFVGNTETKFDRFLEHPAPSVIAHIFEVPRLTAGRYQMQVRLIMRDSTAITTSAPVIVTVR